MFCEFDLNAVADRMPIVGTRQFGGKSFEFRLGRTDNVASAGLAQPCQIFGTGHPTIGDPYTLEHSMSGFHDGYDRPQCFRVMDIAGEYFIAQRKAVESHNERNAHLLAVRALVARIASLGVRVSFSLTLKICACYVVKQHLILNGK